MSRPILGCMTCVGYAEGYYWTRDQNDARWLVIPDNSVVPGGYRAYSDQYGIEGQWSPAIYLGPANSEQLIWAMIKNFATVSQSKKLKAPQDPDDVGFNSPFKGMDGITPTFGPPTPPPGTIPQPGGLGQAGKESNTGNYILMGAIGIAAIALFTGTLKVR